MPEPMTPHGGDRRSPMHLNGRTLAALLSAFAFVAMVCSGLVLFAAPSGRVARLTDWSIAGLARQDWLALHVGFALLFVGAGLFHLAFNWRAMRHHLAARISQPVRIRLELPLALGLCALLAAAAIGRWPPFDAILDAHRKGSGATPEQRGPVRPGAVPEDGSARGGWRPVNPGRSAPLRASPPGPCARPGRGCGSQPEPRSGSAG